MFIQFPLEKRRMMIERIQEYVYQEHGEGNWRNCC